MDERDRDRPSERVRDSEHTTVIHSDRDRGSGGGILAAIAVLLLVGVLLFFLFRGGLGAGGDEGDVNVNIGAPEVTMPEVELPDVETPDVNVSMPETGEAEGNAQKGSR